MLVEDFNKENIMIDYIITECKRLKCMDSLNAFMLGDTKYSVIGRDSYGTYTPKTVIKSKKLPHLLFKESDSLLRKNKAPLISKGLSVTKGHTNGHDNQCIVFLPNDVGVCDYGNYNADCKRKNKQLLKRLTHHLNKKTAMDEFEVGECLSKIDMFSNNSITANCKNFSEAYSNVVDMYPESHKVMATYYFKPLKEWMEDCLSKCPMGSVELFEEHPTCTVSCTEIPYIKIKDFDLSLDEMRDKFKKRMNGYA